MSSISSKFIAFENSDLIDEEMDRAGSDAFSV
jgi:hypothetical protein